MHRHTRLATKLGLLAILLQGCALPLSAEISTPEVEKAHRFVHLPDGRPVEMLRATVRVKGRINNQRYASAIGYKCDGDWFKDRVGAGEVQDDTAFVDFLVERSGDGNFSDYNLMTRPFDICIYISVPAFPLRRESNTVRISADKISKVAE
jgi:hypothetical protein